MAELDTQERLLLKELIRNPRMSDNRIAKRTGIPVMTVNRKRKRIEKSGIISYFTYLDRSESGTGTIHARQMYILKFKSGFTTKDYLDKVKDDQTFREVNPRYHLDSWLGEKDGHLATVVLLEAATEQELIEVFNGQVIPGIKSRHGDDCITEIITCRLHRPIRMHSNYVPDMNMENGIIRDDWPDDYLFVDKRE